MTSCKHLCKHSCNRLKSCDEFSRNSKLETSSDLSNMTSRPLKNSLKSYDDFTIHYNASTAVYRLLFKVKTHYFLWNFFQKICQNFKKMNFRIRCQIQDPTIRSGDINEFQNHREKLSKIENRELPSGVVYFLTIFEHKFFLLNDHETDFSLVYHPPRACTTTPSDKRPPSCGVKENVFKPKNRNVKYQFGNNNINNMFYQYKIQYQYKQNYYMTLTLRPMTSESNKESQKDPDTAEISRVQPTST
jgi:hypothetical protein